MADKTFTLWWRDGRRELVRGRNLRDALRNHGHGKIRFGDDGVSIVSSGGNRDFYWSNAIRQWLPIGRTTHSKWRTHGTRGIVAGNTGREEG